MENLETIFAEFKEHIGNCTDYGDIDEFWEAWHDFTGTSSHPQSVFSLATADGTLRGEKALQERVEREYQHRAAGRPTRRRY